MKSILSKAKSFEKTFFPHCINEWDNLNIENKIARLLNLFKNSILSEEK